MRTILIIVLGLFIAQNVKAQSDTLIIKLDDYGQMVVTSNLSIEKKESLGLNDSYRRFYEDFLKIEKSWQADKNYLLEYTKVRWDDKNNRSISVKAIDEIASIYYFQEGNNNAMLTCKFTLKLEENRKVMFLLDSVEDFKKVSLLNLDTLYIQALEHFQSQNLRKKNSYIVLYSSKDNRIDYSSNFVRNKKSLDMLLMYPTFGMSMINSTFAADASWNVELNFSNKGVDQYKLGLAGTFLFMPDKNDFFKIQTYPFLNLYYDLRFKDKWDHKISVGYMLGSGGNEFSKNTWNAYWQSNINKIGIKIGAYYTKNPEGKYVALPSIGFDFGF